jgi:hypothetical protein
MGAFFFFLGSGAKFFIVLRVIVNVNADTAFQGVVLTGSRGLAMLETNHIGNTHASDGSWKRKKGEYQSAKP